MTSWCSKGHALFSILVIVTAVLINVFNDRDHMNQVTYREGPVESYHRVCSSPQHLLANYFGFTACLWTVAPHLLVSLVLPPITVQRRNNATLYATPWRCFTASASIYAKCGIGLGLVEKVVRLHHASRIILNYCIMKIYHLFTSFLSPRSSWLNEHFLNVWLYWVRNMDFTVVSHSIGATVQPWPSIIFMMKWNIY